MNKKPEKNLYKWGIFYFNPDDENLISPRPKSILGWTLNFAKPLAYVFLLISLLILMLVKRLIA
ncbi:MAG: hypothetical protein LH629_05240 [Ignavibacteria bacterium]|nr:hypothetical protein [Ignavibacteria bacterium]